jgi:cytochrome c peroxidase
MLALLGTPARAQEDGREEEGDPPEVAIGERLFLETRFSQHFFAAANGDANAIVAGDPVVGTLETPAGAVPSPFTGQAMNCRSCHLVDDAKTIPGAGSRSYGDFARQSPIPVRSDGATHTPRNSPPLVNASLARDRPFFLHFDGEFPSAVALVKGTFTGRNFGWLPGEQTTAVHHIAGIVRGDDGSGQLARDFGGSYRKVLAGTDASIPKDFRLPSRFRLDVVRASDDEIVDVVARLVAAYVESLEFTSDESGFSASPYDTFLRKNALPRRPRRLETFKQYLARLKVLLAAREAEGLALVSDPEDGTFMLHSHAFTFGTEELLGFRIFTDRTRGNCVACHTPPNFTDFGFHNTGASQEDYDKVHGAGTFAALPIPDLGTRSANPDAYLPATAAHPTAREPFRRRVAPDRPGETDLGMWNIYQNGDHPDRRQQRQLERLVCESRGNRAACGRLLPTPDAKLDAAVGLFKTPGLRDLGHSAPYLHTGGKDTIEDVLRFYVTMSQLARSDAVRNGAPELARIRIGETDVAPLAAFLRALDEDYE